MKLFINKNFADTNQIKLIESRTFDQLPRLTTVDLRLNTCIDEVLLESQLIKNFTLKIIQNCTCTENGNCDFENKTLNPRL